MLSEYSNIIKPYLKSTTRNKIILFQDSIVGIQPVNIGKLVSEKLKNIPINKKFSFKAKLIIDDVFSSCLIEHEEFGKHIAISNIGILFEPELKIDVNNLFNRYSSSNALFVKWEGVLKDENMFFLTEEYGTKLELKNISHISL
jgi:hypothetical protein